MAVSMNLFTALPTMCTNITITINVIINEMMLRYSVSKLKFPVRKSVVMYENSMAPQIPRINAANEASSATSPFRKPEMAENNNNRPMMMSI
jgi:hypothetical protein